MRLSGFLCLILPSVFLVSAEKKPTIKLATTTSTENSGLLAAILQNFSEESR